MPGQRVSNEQIQINNVRSEEPKPGRQGRFPTRNALGADLAAALGADYVNRFNIRGRACKVIPQIARHGRLNPDQLKDIYVTGSDQQLVPRNSIGLVLVGGMTGCICCRASTAGRPGWSCSPSSCRTRGGIWDSCSSHIT